MKIAILLTDIDVSDFANQFPDDVQKVVSLMQPVVPDWSFRGYPVRDGIFPADILSYDGLIITGSPASVHDDRPWIGTLLELIRKAHRARLATVGICFGHQAIALALGGEVGRNPRGWGLGTVTTEFLVQKPWMKPRLQTIRFWRWHNEVVTRLPEGAEILGRDPLADISAFGIGRHILATQHHPEITEDYMRAMLDQLEGEVDHAVLDGARRTSDLGAEGNLFALWMARFFEQAQD